MRQSGLSIISLAFALLLNASSNVFAATFCPRTAKDHDCCSRHSDKPTSQATGESSCAHEMSGMDMDDMDMSDDTESAFQNVAAGLKADSVSEQNDLVASSEPCQHCLSHSQASSALGVATVGDSSSQSTVSDITTSNLCAHLATRLMVAATPFSHGPPGNSVRLHTLLNIFRI